MNETRHNKIGIIIVHYGDSRLITDLLSSINKSFTNGCFIYVIDNSLSNDVRQIVHGSKFKRKALYIEPHGNLGWAKGANLGARIALKDNCTMLCFLTSDTVIKSKNFFLELIKPFSSGSVGITLPIVVYYNDPSIVWMSGGRFYRLLMLARLLNNNKHISDSKMKLSPDFGGLCMIRADLFEKIKGWNENYFLYYEDVDFGFKVKKFRKDIILVPKSIIAHKVSTPSFRQKETPLNPKNSYFYSRGSLLFIKENLEGLTKYIAIFSQVFIQMPMFVLAMMRQLNFRALVSYFRGFLSGLLILVK